MRHLILLAALTNMGLSIFGQPLPSDPYASLWKKAEQLMQKGLPQSALAEIQAIERRARQQGNKTQQLKALYYQVQASAHFQEDATKQHIRRLQQKLPSAKGPQKALLHSLLGNAYWEYLQENRWKLYSSPRRTSKPDDIDTWSAAELQETITLHFRSALSEADRWRSLPTRDWQPLIQPGSEPSLRPTLYDLLAQAALSYFTQADPQAQSFTDAYAADDSMAFAPATDFVAHRFAISDSFGLKAQALTILQSLLRLHLHDTDPSARLEADLQRLRFAFDQSSREDKEDRYLHALQDLQKAYAKHPAAAQAAFLSLDLERKRLERGHPSDASRTKGMHLAEIVTRGREWMQRHPQSPGASHIEMLLQDLTRPSLTLTAEKVNLPGQPFRLHTSFRNIPEMHYRIIALPDTLQQQLQRRSGDAFWTSVRSLYPLRTVRQPLPDSGDMFHHTTEIRIDALPVGRYLILASPNASFSLSQPLSALVIHLSRIAWITRGRDAFVLDRESGRPLQDAEVKAWRTAYDAERQDLQRTGLVHLRTDVNGHVKLPDPRDAGYSPLRLEATWKEDRLMLEENEPLVYSDDRAWTGVREEYELRYRRLYLFTDRTLYRPGQTVQVKGLLVTRAFETRRPMVVEGYASTLYLVDANGQRRDSLPVVTGAYGSFSASFRLPARGLTGAYTLEEDYGRTEIQVEEYRRPTFEVSWQPADAKARLMDTITLTGTARSLTGVASPRATVRYRVTRSTRFPYPWLARTPGWELPPTQTTEIAHGETRTGPDGRFHISFRALPDPAVPRSQSPVFTFDISADVTDLGGETRSASNTFTLGYHTLQLSISPTDAGPHPNDKDLTIAAGATTLSGLPRPTPVQLHLRPLQGPQRFLRERYWPMTDRTTLSETAYIRSFPYDPYRDEGNRDTWPAGIPIYSRSDTIAQGSKALTIATRGLRPGWYRLELSATEADGQTVTTRTDILLQDPATGLADPYSYFSQHLSTSRAEPGDTAVLTLSTSLDDLWLIELLDGYAGAEVPPTHALPTPNPQHALAPLHPEHSYRFVGLSKGRLALELPIQEEDRGGFGVSHAFVKHNRFHFQQDILTVPWSRQELDLRFQTWRTSTEPGSRESWSVTIHGSKGERVAAELLLSMYDASLDAILPFAWELPTLFDSYPYRYDRYMTQEWKYHSCFTSMSSQDRRYEKPTPRIAEPRPDALLWDDKAAAWQGSESGRLTRGMPIRIRGRSTDLMAMAKPSEAVALAAAPMAKDPGALQEVVQVGYSRPKPPPAPPLAVQFRKDFRETAFFLPELRTDSNGLVRFAFDMPEALTRWKWQALAHTRNLAMAMATQTVVTRKELMVQPNAPRFLREGDRLTLPVRITNCSDSEQTGRARLELFDPKNGQPVDGYFHNVFPEQFFTAPAGETVVLAFTMTVPADFHQPVGLRIQASTGRHTDGEERILPVLSNRILVTASIPLRMNGLGSRAFQFDKLLQSGASPTLTQHRLTLEYAASPAWYAVAALPYLTSYPHACVEQSFNRFYANAVAAQAAASSPRIRDWVKRFATDTTADQQARASSISRQPEGRDILLEETPWVMEARDEEAQRRQLASLFDTVRLASALEQALAQVRAAQNPDGGFAWFQGGPSDRFMSQYILANMGRMQTTGAVPAPLSATFSEILGRGLAYVSDRLQDEYRKVSRQPRQPATPSPLQVQALYTLSCLPDYQTPPGGMAAHRYFRSRINTKWQALPLQSQAMAALTLYRTGAAASAKAILRSLRERAVYDSTLGMYWKGGPQPWYWQDAPIETQSLLLEAFLEIDRDTATADRMRLWLLTKKQTEQWESTRATADACRALLAMGSNWLVEGRGAEVTLGREQPLRFETPAGGSDLRASLDGPAIKPEMGHIRVRVTGDSLHQPPGISWGAVHWQYFEHLDRLTTATGPLGVEKQVLREKMTATGPILEALTEESDVRVGDKLVVRLVLRSDRDMEYVHLKDMRASGTEPADLLSGYQWKGALGYYLSPRDAATHFFLPVLTKGTHVFEYTLFVSHAGQFPAGIATVECLYAPSFRGHTESLQIRASERLE